LKHYHIKNLDKIKARRRTQYGNRFRTPLFWRCREEAQTARSTLFSPKKNLEIPITSTRLLRNFGSTATHKVPNWLDQGWNRASNSSRRYSLVATKILTHIEEGGCCLDMEIFQSVYNLHILAGLLMKNNSIRRPRILGKGTWNI
jgi:hypothetical protein